ncbi:MAG: DNA recombination protein RmuC [Planctomycetota bacterium]
MPDTYLTVGLIVWAVVATGVAGAAIGWALALRAGKRAADERAAEQAEMIDGHREDLLAMGERSQRAERDAAELGERERGFERRLADQQAAFDKRLTEHREAVAEARRQAAEAFESLAGKQLEAANAKFLQLAETKFRGEQKAAEGELDKRRQAIDAMLKPINDALRKQEEAFTSMDRRHRESHGGLTEQIRGLLDAQRHLSGTTDSLVKALRRPEVRGRWGEMQLRRVAEVAGMIHHCDFDEQVTVADGRRPDMVVRLPADRTIVVDAKNTIDAYLSAIEAGGDDEREQYLGDHVMQLEQQVGALATKGYQSQFDRSPDFVVLFVPVESALQAALQRKPGLMESAMTRGVVIATPSTLIALLKAVAMGWREEKVAENAQRISQLGQELHERIATLVGHVEKLGGSLETAVNHYNKAVGTLDSRVLVTTRKFKELGADSSKELPAEGEVKAIESAVREVKTVDAE